MKKVLIVLVFGIILVFAFRALLNNDDEVDLSGQVTKDIEGEGTQNLANKADALETLAYEKYALAQEKYDDLKDFRDDVSDISLQKEIEDEMDNLASLIDKTQNRIDDSAFEDAIDSAQEIITTANSLLNRNKDDDDPSTPEETLDKRQELRLRYAETVQEMEDLILERSQNTDKDYYTDEIEDLQRYLDNIKYELALLDAAAGFDESKEDLEKERLDIVEKIDSKKTRIEKSETRITEYYTKLNDVTDSDAYSDAQYNRIIDLVSEKSDIWEKIDDEYANIDEYNDDISKLHEELRDVEKKLNYISDMILLKESLAEIQYTITDTEKEIDDLHNEYQLASKSKKKSLSDDIEELEEDLQDLQTKKNSISSYIEDFEKKVEI